MKQLIEKIKKLFFSKEDVKSIANVDNVSIKETVTVTPDTTEKSNSSKSETQKIPHGIFRCLFRLPQNIIHPADMFEQLCIAACMYTNKPVAVNSSDIMLMRLHECNNHKYLGCFYCIEIDGLYFGSIIGKPAIIVCRKDAFIFEPSDQLWLPLQNGTDKSLYFLSCTYSRSNGNLKANGIKKQLADGKVIELKKFDSVKQALTEAEDIINKDLSA